MSHAHMEKGNFAFLALTEPLAASVFTEVSSEKCFVLKAPDQL